MLLPVTIFLVCLNLVYKNSKLFFLMLLFWLWILFGWSYGTADYQIYMNRYNFFIEKSIYTEPVFTLIQKLAHIFQLDFREFLVAISFLGLLLIGKTIYDLSSNFGFTLALYSIFPFVIDVTVIRFFLASSIIIFGFRYLLDFSLERKTINDFLWIICVTIASLVHMSCIFFYIFLVPKRLNVFWTCMVTLIFSFLVFLSVKLGYLSTMLSFFSLEKYEILLSVTTLYDVHRLYLNVFRVSFIFIQFVIVSILYWLGEKRVNFIATSKLAVHFGIDNIIQTGIKFNVITLLVLPLLLYSVDFFRIQLVLMTLNYILYSSLLKPVTKFKINMMNFTVSLIISLFLILNLYFLVLGNGNINTVFKPLFSENILFQ